MLAGVQHPLESVQPRWFQPVISDGEINKVAWWEVGRGPPGGDAIGLDPGRVRKRRLPLGTASQAKRPARAQPAESEADARLPRAAPASQGKATATALPSPMPAEMKMVAS